MSLSCNPGYRVIVLCFGAVNFSTWVPGFQYCQGNLTKYCSQTL